MPEVSIVALKGRTVEQKRALVKDITEAVVKNFEVSPDKVTVIINHAHRTCYDEDPSKGSKSLVMPSC